MQEWLEMPVVLPDGESDPGPLVVGPAVHSQPKAKWLTMFPSRGRSGGDLERFKGLLKQVSG